MIFRRGSSLYRLDGGHVLHLTYIGLAHLYLNPEQVDLMVFGQLLDLVDFWRIETGRAEPARVWFIDDVIPTGL